MNRIYSIFFLIAINLGFNSKSVTATGRLWSSDELGASFQNTIFQLGYDESGPVKAVLVRKSATITSNKGILYIHGFSDYFFQSEMAGRFTEKGFNFFALDLRKYGRSLLPEQEPFQVKNISEYFPEIDSAIKEMRASGINDFYIVGHSTGGLISSLYIKNRGSIKGCRGLILNSPFLEFNTTPFNKRFAIPLISFFGKIFGRLKIRDKHRSFNCESIHKSLKGEWDFDTLKKPVAPGFVTWRWIRAIHKGHLEIKRGLNLNCPVLVMFSNRSYKGDKYSDICKKSDSVLDVADIEKYSGKIGVKTTKVVIPDGIHDLVLSRKDVRERVYQTMFNWIDTLP